MSEHSDADPRPGPAPSPVETGDPRVDAALESLRALADLPVDEHPAVYERVHAELRAVLAHAGDPAAPPAAAPDPDDGSA